MRYFIEFAYDGAPYFGYQIQPNQISVQETLEKALGDKNKFVKSVAAKRLKGD